MQFVGIGQDSHRFEPDHATKPLVLGGIVIPGCPGLIGNSDADVVLHAVVNAVSGISTVNILGAVSDKMCIEQGIRDSAAFLAEALKHLRPMRPVHLSVSIECMHPRLSGYVPEMRIRLAELLGLSPGHVGITATSGEGLTAFGLGEGIFCTAVLTATESDQEP